MEQFRVTVNILNAEMQVIASHTVEVAAPDAIRAPSAAVVHLRRNGTPMGAWHQAVLVERQVELVWENVKPTPIEKPNQPSTLNPEVKKRKKKAQ